MRLDVAYNDAGFVGRTSEGGIYVMFLYMEFSNFLTTGSTMQPLTRKWVRRERQWLYCQGTVTPRLA